MSHQIELSVAVDMTARYRATKPTSAAISETFEISDVKTLVSNPACAFLRIYYGMKADGSVHAILVGADTSGVDIVSSDSGGVILEDASFCPPDCAPASVLNS